MCMYNQTEWLHDSYRNTISSNNNIAYIVMGNFYKQLPQELLKLNGLLNQSLDKMCCSLALQI